MESSDTAAACAVAYMRSAVRLFIEASPNEASDLVQLADQTMDSRPPAKPNVTSGHKCERATAPSGRRSSLTSAVVLNSTRPARRRFSSSPRHELSEVLRNT